MVAHRLSSTRRSVVTQIVGLILPTYPDLDESTRASICADVTGFVESQIGRMPSFLRVPYRLAITGFQLLPMLRYGRTFLQLGREARQVYLTFWNEGPLPFTGEFAELIRSCALLAYFDHPEVRLHLPKATPVPGVP